MKKTRPKKMEVSLHKSVADEIETLRKTLRSVGNHYLDRLDRQLVELHERTLAAAESCGADPRGNQVRDLRDMLMVMRALVLKPEAGRRKDLRKIDAAIEELALLSAWRAE